MRIKFAYLRSFRNCNKMTPDWLTFNPRLIPRFRMPYHYIKWARTSTFILKWHHYQQPFFPSNKMFSTCPLMEHVSAFNLIHLSFLPKKGKGCVFFTMTTWFSFDSTHNSYYYVGYINVHIGLVLHVCHCDFLLSNSIKWILMRMYQVVSDNIYIQNQTNILS